MVSPIYSLQVKVCWAFRDSAYYFRLFVMAVGDGPIDLDTIGVEQALGQWWFMGGLRLPWPMDDGDRNRSHPGL